MRFLELGGADRRIAAIAGYGFQTIDHLADVRGEFYYRYSYNGDGTVPAARAPYVQTEVGRRRMLIQRKHAPRDGNSPRRLSTYL